MKNMNISNEARELIRDYLNGELKEIELINLFDLKQCEECKNYELEEDIQYNDIQDKHLCETCRDELKGEWQ